MKISTAILFAFTISMSYSQAQTNNMDSELRTIYDQRYREAYKKYFERDFPEAIVLFTRLLDMDNNAPGIYHNRGISKALLGDHRGALSDFRKASEIAPKDFLYAQEICSTLSQMKDYHQSISEVNKFLMKFNQPHEKACLLIQRGENWVSLNAMTKAIADFEEALSLESHCTSNGKAYYYRGVHRIASNQVDQGCLDLSKAGELGHDVYDLIKKYCN